VVRLCECAKAFLALHICNGLLSYVG
jgi:hypothetical protein